MGKAALDHRQQCLLSVMSVGHYRDALPAVQCQPVEGAEAAISSAVADRAVAIDEDTKSGWPIDPPYHLFRQ